MCIDCVKKTCNAELEAKQAKGLGNLRTHELLLRNLKPRRARENALFVLDIKERCIKTEYRISSCICFVMYVCMDGWIVAARRLATVAGKQAPAKMAVESADVHRLEELS